MTPHERYQRLLDLKGEMKRAQECIAECDLIRADKARQLAIAEEQKEVAHGRLEALRCEARRLGDEAKADFEALLEDKPPAQPHQEAVDYFNAVEQPAARAWRIGS